MNIMSLFTRVAGVLAVATFLITTFSPLVFAEKTKLKRQEKMELQKSLRSEAIRSAAELGKEFRRIKKENARKQDALKEDFDRQIENASDVATKRSLLAEYTRQRYALKAEFENKRSEAEYQSDDALMVNKEKIYKSFGMSVK